MSLSLAVIEAAQKRICKHVVETSLLRMEALDEVIGCEVYAKAECMQRTGSFKLRGAINKLLTLSADELACGIVAASSGNHGRAVAYGAKLLGTKATIVMPDTALPVKMEAIRALGADIVVCKAEERMAVAAQLCEEKQATLVPPYNDEAVMAGQGTAGLEIMTQLPDVDVVVAPVSGGGLIGGVSTAVKGINETVRVYGAEPSAVPRYSKSLAKGERLTVVQHPSRADALVSNTPGELCFPVVQAHVDGVVTVDDEAMLRAQYLLLTQGKLFAEPSSSIGLAAVMTGAIKVKPQDKVCFVISGGNLGLEQLDILKTI